MSKGRSFSYTIEYTKAAEKFMKAHEDVREEYEAAIEELLFGEHPEKVDVKRIVGKKNEYFQIRIRNWRVVYAVINGIVVTINTILAGPRGDVYKKTSGLK